MICKNCGTENDERNLSCSNCGAELAAEENTKNLTDLLKNKKILGISACVLSLVIIVLLVVVDSVIVPNQAASQMRKAFESKTGLNVMSVFAQYCGDYSVIYEDLSKSGKKVFLEFESCVSDLKDDLNSQPAETDINNYLLDSTGDIVLPREYSAITEIGQYNIELNSAVVNYYELYLSKIAYEEGNEFYNSGNFGGAINSFKRVIEYDSLYDDAQNKLAESQTKLLDEKIALIEKYIKNGEYEAAQQQIFDLREDSITDEIKKKLDEYEEKINLLKVRLSDDCDLILSTGSDGDDYYELVAVQEETYDTCKIKIGVIKNNKWIVPLTTDIPFIGKDGFIRCNYDSWSYGNYSTCDLNGTPRIKGNSYTKIEELFIYLGNGCFFDSGSEIIFNSNNKKSFEFKNKENGPVLTAFIDKNKPVNETDNKIVVSIDEEEYYHWSIALFDTNTMELKTIQNDVGYQPMNAISEGIYAVGDHYGQGKLEAFCDMEGNEIIDMRSYNITERGKCYFENSLYSFTVKNQASSKYKLTINTKGEIINEEKVV